MRSVKRERCSCYSDVQTLHRLEHVDELSISHCCSRGQRTLHAAMLCTAKVPDHVREVPVYESGSVGESSHRGNEQGGVGATQAIQ